MAELRPGWRVWRFDQMAANINERVDNPSEAGVDRYVGLEHLDPDSLKIRRWGSPSDVEATKLRFYPGDIIFGRRRAYQRKLGVADFEGICSAHAMVLRAKPDVVLPEFLPFFMQSDLFMERALEISVGSLSPTINWRTLAAQEFALPPLDEQRRIARSLSASVELKDAYSWLAISARTALQAVQKKYFIDQPKGDLVRISDVADVQNGTTPRTARTEYWNGDIPWLPTGKVNERIIEAADNFITKKALAECSLSIVPAGSVLIAMIGQGQTRGKVARLNIDACINQNFAAVVPTGKIEPWYLFYQLETYYEKLRAWSQGTNQHALNCALIREFPIWLPTVEYQLTIVEEMQGVDRAIRSAKWRRDKSRMLERTIQQGLLT